MKAGPEHWASFREVWEQANTIRSFIWTQDSSDEAALFKQFLVRLRRFLRVDFCFMALRQEDGKIFQLGVPEEALERLPVDFACRSMELIANSRIPVRWSRSQARTEYRSIVVSPLSPPVGEPLGVLILGHCRAREFNQAEMFSIQSLAGEVSWAIRELRAKENQRRLLSAASQELKSSLAAVLRECSLARELDTVPMVTPAQAFSTIEKSTQEALRAIGSFLDSTAEQEGRLSVVREPIDLVTVVNTALNDCQAKAERAGSRLERLYAKDLPRTYVTDPARFRQVLREIVEQAIAVARGPLIVNVRHNNDFIEIDVTASGAPPANQAAGAHPSVSSQSPGNLAFTRMETVRENVDLLNGHLHLLKLPGNGIEIGLCLPKCEQTRAECEDLNFVGK
ncbi:MAG TPA: GAF domain-containing protein [Gammaproteobacteria bacterium]|nr:GAF domain-containing protein [Gammaproteobacteria bacterium]